MLVGETVARVVDEVFDSGAQGDARRERRCFRRSFSRHAQWVNGLELPGMLAATGLRLAGSELEYAVMPRATGCSTYLRDRRGRRGTGNAMAA